MKKTALFLFAFFAFSVPLRAAEPAAVVTDTQGKAYILRGDQTLPAEPGMAINKGDSFKTEADGRLDVALNHVAGVRLLGETEAGYQESDRENMQLDLKLGNIIVNMKKKFKGAKFQVATPAAVLAVRGTQFWGREAKQEDKNVTTFAVRQGTVEITDKSTGQNFTLKKGQALDLSAEAKGPSVRKALGEEMATMEQASQIKTSGKAVSV